MIVGFQMGNAHQIDTGFYDLLLCYLATDSYDPEALRELLSGDPKLSAAFRTNLQSLGFDGNWSVEAARRDLNYGFKDSNDLKKWLLDLDSFLFGDGPVP